MTGRGVSTITYLTGKRNQVAELAPHSVHAASCEGTQYSHMMCRVVEREKFCSSLCQSLIQTELHCHGARHVGWLSARSTCADDLVQRRADFSEFETCDVHLGSKVMADLFNIRRSLRR